MRRRGDFAAVRLNLRCLKVAGGGGDNFICEYQTKDNIHLYSFLIFLSVGIFMFDFML